MTPHPIITITLNPTLDIAAQVDAVVAGPKLRLHDPQSEPGGGGVNVARAVRILGGAATALVAYGGATGAQAADLLAREGVAVHRLPATGETRQSLTVTDAAGAQFRFVMPGPSARPAADLLAAIGTAVPPGALVVLSGSQPPGLPADFPLLLARLLADRHCCLIIDTSGPPLAQLTRTDTTAIDTLRMNHRETEEAAGRPLPTLPVFAGFCQALVHRGTARVAIAGWGADGNILADGTGVWHCIPPPGIPVVSRVGAGDSFTAGYVLARSRATPLPEALRLGTAAAAAAVMTPGTQLCRRTDVERILPECRLVEITPA